MSAELGVGLALRAVNERVQQAMARRSQVRKGTAWDGGQQLWGGGRRVGTGRHDDAEGSPEGRNPSAA